MIDSDRPPDDFGSVDAPRSVGLGRDCAGGRSLSRRTFLGLGIRMALAAQMLGFVPRLDPEVVPTFRVVNFTISDFEITDDLMYGMFSEETVRLAAKSIADDIDRRILEAYTGPEVRS